MAYLIVWKSGEAWKIANQTILLTQAEANAFLAAEMRNHPTLTHDVAEVALPPFATEAQEAA